MSDICVVHLVRASNGLEPFKKFLESYFRNDAGIGHDLLIIYKGFAAAGSADEYEKLLGSYPHRTFFVKDFGFDIRPYLLAVKSYHYRYFCFLNSYSEILAKGWLEKLYLHCSREEVGLVGATGSWHSLYTDAVRLKTMLENEPVWRQLPARCYSLARFWVARLFFPPFPNVHIRTNAFMVSRETMLRVKSRPIFSKLDAWRFESGWQGLTRQVRAMNLKTVVVGRDGAGYDEELWCESCTYKQRDQANLLVADNQTKHYEMADGSARRELSFQAWGGRSDVAVSDETLREK